MPSVYVATVIDAPLERVWSTIRDFNALPQWHPFIESSRIEDGLHASAIGCIRNFQLKDNGGTIREQLLALSDVDHSCTYSIVEAPLPLRNYRATLRLFRISTTNQTFGQWQAAFDVPLAEQEAAVRLVSSVFEEGLKNLSQVLKH